MPPEDKDYIVQPMARHDETIAYRQKFSDAVQRAVQFSLEEKAPYGVYLDQGEGVWEPVGTAYQGIYTPMPPKKEEVQNHGL